jgi:methylglutamate dehydrogenase subunit A
VFRENVYVIADSNHGYKMIGVGKLVAQELMGEKSRLLEPFRMARFREGRAASDLAQSVPVELRQGESD